MSTFPNPAVPLPSLVPRLSTFRCVSVFARMPCTAHRDRHRGCMLLCQRRAIAVLSVLWPSAKMTP